MYLWQEFSGMSNPAITLVSTIFKEKMQGKLSHFHTWVTSKLTNKTPLLKHKAAIIIGLLVQKTEKT